MVCLVLIAMFGVASTGFSYDPKQIDARVVQGLEDWDKVVTNSEEIIAKADGILVCPKITKVGLGVGAERGNCSLMIDGETVEYWRASAASIGLTAGVQTTGSVVAFMTPEALEKFRSSDRGWEAGVDGSITVAKVGAQGTMSTAEMRDPIMGWIYSSQGLMADLSFKGATYKRIGTEADVAKFADPFHRFVATADVADRASKGAATLQLTIDISDWVDDTDREAMAAIIRTEGTAKARSALEAMPAIGEIRHGGKSIPIQWARATEKPGDEGFRVNLISSEPLGFAWEEKSEDNFSIIQMDVNLQEKSVGTGVIQMGAELSVDDTKGISIVGGPDLRPIRLTSVSYKKIE
jgi:lipid-binding SYLF domain-containing protein